MKQPRLALLVCSVSLCTALALPGCQGKGTTPTTQAKQAKQAKATPSTDAKTPAAEAKSPAPSPTPGTADPSPTDAKTPPPAPPADAKDLGQHLLDPTWFRKTMFGDKGKVLDTKRSEADEQGHFSSLIRFELTDMNIEACADHLQEMVKGDVPNVERKTESDGRIQLTGNTDRFKLTFICGESDGKTIAFVSYIWT